MTTWNVPATVVRVVDGDTVRLDLDLGWHIRMTSNVRLSRIDAPEVKTIQGVMAKNYLAARLSYGDKVTFLSERLDKYGRPLGVITAKDIITGELYDVADDMVAHGHAEAL